jgi:hypothetical protein
MTKMFGRSAVACFLLALALHLRDLADAHSGESTAEKKAQKDKCHDQVKETPTNNPYHRNYPCAHLNQLQYFTVCDCVARPDAPGNSGFTSAEKTILLNHISQMETLLEGTGGTITDTVVVQVSLALQVFFESQPSIALAIGVQSVNDSTGVFFGTLHDFKHMHVALQFDVVSQVLVLDANGKSQVSKDIKAAAQANGNQVIITECQNFTTHLDDMLAQPGYNLTEHLSFIYQHIVKECSPSTIAFLNAQVTVTGFGSFKSIHEMGKVHYRIQKKHDYMAGHDQTDCPFLKDLKTTWNATCFGPPGSGNNSVCATLGNYVDQITAVFTGFSGDTELLMVKCVDVTWEMCKAAPWVYNINLQSAVEGDALSDFVFDSGHCHNEDVCDWSGPPPPLPVCSCDQPPSTTPTAPTPTPTLSHCDNRQSVIAITPACNCSSLFVSITQVTNTWSVLTGQKQSINPILNQLRIILYSSESMSQKMADVWGQINSYNPNNGSWKTQFLAITIYYSDMVTVWGTVSDFATCGSTCGC